ncbi:MAG: transcriptional repressor LexA [Clostridia bacterium]|nr:transcriptional repressor LexA [Clostridia bacterium]
MSAHNGKRGDTQNRILAYIQSEIEQRGYAPSVREIGEAVGLKSTSTVHGHLMRLEKKGLLHRDAMKPRAMGLGQTYRPQQEDVAVRDDVHDIPVVGRVAAGLPILALEQVEDVIPLPSSLTGEGEHFILRVRGDSMIEAGILNNDYIVVRRQQEAENGEIVVAMIDDEATVKRFYRDHNGFRLQPENSDMLPIWTDHVEILGKVVSLFRRI